MADRRHANSLDAKEDGDDTAPAALPRAASSPAVERLRDLYADLVPISARTAGLGGAGGGDRRRACGATRAGRRAHSLCRGNVLSLVHGHGVVEQEEFGERGTRVWPSAAVPDWEPAPVPGGD